MRDRDIAFGPIDENAALVSSTLFGVLVDVGLDRARAYRIDTDTGLPSSSANCCTMASCAALLAE